MTLRLRWDQLYIDREGISQILRDDSSKKKKIRKECVAQIVTDELSVLEISQPPHSPDLTPVAVKSVLSFKIVHIYVHKYNILFRWLFNCFSLILAP